MMTSTPSDPAGAEIPLVMTLVDRYYGMQVHALTFLGGEIDRNYRLTTADGATYLARLQLPVQNAAELQWQEAILLHLLGKDLGVAVPTIARAADGSLHVPFESGSDNGVLRVLNWVSGTELNKVAQHSPALLRQLGATAARVTLALDGFAAPNFPATHHWDVTRSGEAIHECLSAAPELIDSHGAATVLGWFSEIEPVLRELPRVMVHQDLNDNNVLVELRDGVQVISGVLDFNDALCGPRVAEPAIAGAYAMLRKDDPLQALGHVVAGYHAVVPLARAEIDVIYPLAAARLCVQVLTWTVRARTNPTAYGSMRMRHTLPTLERLLTIDPRTAGAHLRSMCDAEPRRESK
jgi:Ser/Thr protein kinase RdoA (MazF antagonist)